MKLAKLAEIRMRKGLTLSELANQSGVNKGLISRIETGNRKSFQEDTMRKLAVALGVTISEVEEFENLIQLKLKKEGVPTQA